MEQIQQIYNDLRDNNEFDIIERYGNIAKYYTSGLTCKISLIFRFLLYYIAFYII